MRLTHFEQAWDKTWFDTPEITLAAFGNPKSDGRCTHRNWMGLRCKRRAGIGPDRWWCVKHCVICNRHS